MPDKKSFWFLSEMSVTNRHGGGVTLQRTLGEGLVDFQGFVGVYDGHEFDERFSSRSYRWLPFTHSNFCRRLLGSRISHWMTLLPATENFYAALCAWRLNRILPTSDEAVNFLISPQRLFSIYTLQKLRKMRPVKYATWVMDDNWVKWKEHTGWHYPLTVERRLKKHFLDAEVVVTISQPMGEHYHQKFGVDYEVLFAPSPNDATQVSQDFSPVKKLAYFGTLSTWPLDTLVRLVPLLPLLGYKLDIYSHHLLPADLLHSHVCKMPPLAPEKVQETMQNYDAVLLPIGFSSDTASYTHFNIATKMAECLGSGSVTLAIGPEHAAMMRYLQTYDIGLCVNEVSPSALAKAFNVLQNHDLRRQRIEKDLAHTKTHLTKSVVRKHWESIRDRVACQTLP